MAFFSNALHALDIFLGAEDLHDVASLSTDSPSAATFGTSLLRSAGDDGVASQVTNAEASDILNEVAVDSIFSATTAVSVATAMTLRTAGPPDSHRGVATENAEVVDREAPQHPPKVHAAHPERVQRAIEEAERRAQEERQRRAVEADARAKAVSRAIEEAEARARARAGDRARRQAQARELVSQAEERARRAAAALAGAWAVEVEAAAEATAGLGRPASNPEMLVPATTTMTLAAATASHLPEQGAPNGGSGVTGERFAAHFGAPAAAAPSSRSASQRRAGLGLMAPLSNDIAGAAAAKAAADVVTAERKSHTALPERLRRFPSARDEPDGTEARRTQTGSGFEVPVTRAPSAPAKLIDDQGGQLKEANSADSEILSLQMAQELRATELLPPTTPPPPARKPAASAVKEAAWVQAKAMAARSPDQHQAATGARRPEDRAAASPALSPGLLARFIGPRTPSPAASEQASPVEPPPAAAAARAEAAAVGAAAGLPNDDATAPQDVIRYAAAGLERVATRTTNSGAFDGGQEKTGRTKAAERGGCMGTDAADGAALHISLEEDDEVGSSRPHIFEKQRAGGKRHGARHSDAHNGFAAAPAAAAAAAAPHDLCQACMGLWDAGSAIAGRLYRCTACDMVVHAACRSFMQDLSLCPGAPPDDDDD
ncbi:unnamed protein product, partial [Phaeothamnion confervicola]